MDRLKELTYTLDRIKTVSGTAIETAIDLLQGISEDESDIVEDLKDELPGLDRELILGALSTTVSDLIADSEKVSVEIDMFITSILKGKNTLEDRQESYRFLYEVWSGDIYDEKKLDALKTLLGDLQRQFLSLNTDFILGSTIARLTG